MVRYVFVILASAVLCSGCHDSDPQDGRRQPLLVFAAASLRDVAADLAAEFETQPEGLPIVFNFAGSNTLAQQIRAAPGADVFLSADGTWVDFLEEAGRTVEGTRRPFLTNRLVVAAHTASTCRINRPSDLARAHYRYLALGDPAGVPAGRYAQAILEREPLDGHENLWAAIADRVVPAPDVRAAIALVETDPEVLGIVYKTDVLREPTASRRVRILFELEPQGEVSITYWAALIENGERREQAVAFLDFLDSPSARRIAERHGFGPPS